MDNPQFTLLLNPTLSDAQCADIAAVHRAVRWGHPGSELDLRDLYEDSSYSLLALDGERVVGLLRAESDNPQTTWLAELAVLPDYQGHGIGKALLARFIADHPGTRLYTDATEGVEEFFLRHGIGLRQGSVPGPKSRV